MNYNKMTKAQLIEIINGLQDELVYAQKAVPAPQQVQAKTTTHAEIMRMRMAAAKAQAMSTGVAVKA